MKLLDPLNGIKWSQMHWMWHLTMYLTMYLVNTDISDKTLQQNHNQHDINISDNPIVKTIHATDLQSLTDNVPSNKDKVLSKIKKRHFQEEIDQGLVDADILDQILSFEGHAAGGGQSSNWKLMTPKMRHEQEVDLFKILRNTHITMFLSQMIQLFLKAQGSYDFAQVIGALQLALLQVPFLFNIYFCKSRMDYWIHAGAWSDVRIILILEVSVFFTWIFAGILFLAFAYVVKFKSITKSETIQNADDNVWNDKYSDDFMRYIKSEMYNVCHFTTMMVTTFVIGLAYDGEIELMGPRDWFPTKILFILMNVVQIYFISVFIYSLMNQILITSQRSKFLTKIYLILLILDVIVVTGIYFGTGQLEGQNQLCQIWVKIRMVHYLMEMLSMGEMLRQIGFFDKHQKSEEEQLLILRAGKDWSESELDFKINDEKRKNELIAMIKNKETLEFEHDFVTMACFSFLKENELKFWLTPQKRAQIMNQALTIQLTTFAMLSLVYYAIATNEDNRFTPTYAQNFPIFIVKVACVIALHFVIYPEVSKGLNIMKLTNQHPGIFVTHGSNVSYILGLIQVTLAVLAEILNIYMLTFQHTIEHCIMHFVAFEIIVELGNIYYESLMNNKLKTIVHHPPKFNEKQVGENKDPRPWKNRTCFHKVGRCIYKILRCTYVSLNFYMVPFSVIIWQFEAKIPKGGAHH